ncbi:MAG TPA: alpha/beta hydrolase, partial [Lacunisphaera sp.]|nr:alpha/beta hydrolase [Lacunisphaera sp.]
SDMDDAGGLFKRLARELAAKGIASLRINFRGEGDAKRTDIASTFATRLEDTASAHAWLAEQRGVNASRLGVLGFSLGASTAIETGAQYPDWFKTMAVWSSPSGDQFAMFMADETAQKAMRDGKATEDVPGWKKITTKREFYESFRGIDLDKSLAKYPGAFLTVRGTKDMLAQHDEVFLKIAPGEPKEKLIIEGADHIFHVFDGEKGQAAQVIEATVAWFGRTL